MEEPQCNQRFADQKLVTDLSHRFQVEVKTTTLQILMSNSTYSMKSLITYNRELGDHCTLFTKELEVLLANRFCEEYLAGSPRGAQGT